MRLSESLVHVGGRAVPSLVGFVTAMLLTWLLPPAEYGIYALGIAFVALGHAVLYEWLVNAVVRWYQARADHPAFMPTVLALAALLTGGAALLVVLGSVGGLFGAVTGHVWILLFGVAAYGWFELVSYLQIARFHAWRFLLLGLVRAGLVLGASLAAALLTGRGESVLIAGFAAGLLAALVFSRDAELRPRRGFNAPLARAFFAYGWPMGLTVVLFGLTTQGSRILVGALAGIASAGAFAVAYTLVQTTISVIAQGAGAAGFSHAVRAAETGDPAAAERQLRHNAEILLALLLPAGAGLALTTPGIAGLLVEPGYRAAVAELAPWLIVSAVLAGLRGRYFDTAFQLGRRTGLLVQVMAVGTALSLLLGILLIPRLGAVGAAIGMAAAAAVSLLHSVWLGRRCFAMPRPWGAALRVAVATLVMAAAVLAVRQVLPGRFGVLAEIAAGVLAYGAAAVALDVCGLRRLARPRAWRRAPAPG